MIDYDDLRKKAEAAIRGETFWNFSPRDTLQLLEIIKVAKRRLESISLFDQYQDCNGAIFEAVAALEEIAKIENR